MALTRKELSFRFSVFKQRGDIASFSLAEEVMRLFQVDLREAKYGEDVWRMRYS